MEADGEPAIGIDGKRRARLAAPGWRRPPCATSRPASSSSLVMLETVCEVRPISRAIAAREMGPFRRIVSKTMRRL